MRLPRPKPTRWCTSARRLPAGKSRRSRRAACALGSVVPAGGKWPHTTEPESTFGPAVQQNVAINQFMRADVLDASPNSVKKNGTYGETGVFLEEDGADFVEKVVGEALSLGTGAEEPIDLWATRDQLTSHLPQTQLPIPINALKTLFYAQEISGVYLLVHLFST